MKQQYLTHIDLWDADGNCFAEAGTVTDAIPQVSIPWLLAYGYIELYNEPEQPEGDES